MLKKIDRNIWLAEQPFQYLGFSLGRRMTVIPLENGELVIIYPIISIIQ